MEVLVADHRMILMEDPIAVGTRCLEEVPLAEGHKVFLMEDQIDFGTKCFERVVGQAEVHMMMMSENRRRVNSRVRRLQRPPVLLLPALPTRIHWYWWDLGFPCFAHQMIGRILQRKRRQALVVRHVALYEEGSFESNKLWSRVASKKRRVGS